MATTMQAVRFHGKTDIRLEQIPIPVCGKGKVKVCPLYAMLAYSNAISY
jgi:hypothetical protein